MGASKTSIFNTEQNELAALFKALAHPARIAILQELFKMESCACGSLTTTIGLAQPTVSQHLKELKNAGLIQGTIDGTSVCYCINASRWQEIEPILSAFLTQQITPASCC